MHAARGDELTAFALAVSPSGVPYLRAPQEGDEVLDGTAGRTDCRGLRERRWRGRSPPRRGRGRHGPPRTLRVLSRFGARFDCERVRPQTSRRSAIGLTPRLRPSASKRWRRPRPPEPAPSTSPLPRSARCGRAHPRSCAASSPHGAAPSRTTCARSTPRGVSSGASLPPRREQAGPRRAVRVPCHLHDAAVGVGAPQHRPLGHALEEYGAARDSASGSLRSSCRCSAPPRRAPSSRRWSRAATYTTRSRGRHGRPGRSSKSCRR